MIIGDNKGEVIENIKKATELEEFNKKVEVNDPNLSEEHRYDITCNRWHPECTESEN